MSFDESRPRRRRAAPPPKPPAPPGTAAAAPDPAPGAVGARLVYYRERAGLSQSELSRLTGVPKSTISLIEAGGTSPRTDTLQQLAPGVGATVAELLGEFAPGAGDLTPEDAMFVRDFQRLPAELQAQMREYLEFLRRARDRRPAGPSPAAEPTTTPRESGAGGGGGR